MDTEWFDRSEMEIVHTMLRREFGLMPGLVSGVVSRERSRIVADHLDTISTTLHHHHHSEDVDVWPLLMQRTGGVSAELIELMESQHQQLSAALHRAQTRVREWARGTTPISDDPALADDMSRVVCLLNEHLHTEEELVVPLMEQHITVPEWQEMIQKGGAGIDPETLIVGFGMLMYEGDPEVVGRAVANMPADARPIIESLAATAFADHSRQVHGTATPPRSTELSQKESHA